jgi:hypothetical protein
MIENNLEKELMACALADKMWFWIIKNRNNNVSNLNLKIS